MTIVTVKIYNNGDFMKSYFKLSLLLVFILFTVCCIVIQVTWHMSNKMLSVAEIFQSLKFQSDTSTAMAMANIAWAFMFGTFATQTINLLIELLFSNTKGTTEAKSEDKKDKKDKK